jgi:hypothetical protein
MYLQSDDVDTILVRMTADFSPDLERYDPAEDADLYEEFLSESEGSSAPLFQKNEQGVTERTENLFSVSPVPSCSDLP